MVNFMEININCDLGEKSEHHSTKYDPDLLKIVNSANIACGFHAGDEQTMISTIEISKKNNVSIGAHPSFNDPRNFGRKRHNLAENEIKTLNDLAELDSEELFGILGKSVFVNEDDAGSVIMKAREHWFSEEAIDD